MYQYLKTCINNKINTNTALFRSITLLSDCQKNDLLRIIWYKKYQWIYPVAGVYSSRSEWQREEEQQEAARQRE